MSAPTVRFSAWGELPAERPLLGEFLRVLVNGEHVGAVQRDADRWVAQWYATPTRGGLPRDRYTEHATVDDAVRAVLRPGWARRLGARAASRVSSSDKARRRASRLGVTHHIERTAS